jgi:hypothetical protein
MDIHQARTEAKHEKTDANLKEIIAEIRAWQKLMEACLERTEATDLEANPEELGSKSEHLEVRKDAAMETIGALEKRKSHIAYDVGQQSNC